MTIHDHAPTARPGTRRPIRRLIATAITVAVVFSGCGSDTPPRTVAPPTTAPPATTDAPPPSATPAISTPPDDATTPIATEPSPTTAPIPTIERPAGTATPTTIEPLPTTDSPSTTTLDEYLEEHCRTRCDLDKW